MRVLKANPGGVLNQSLGPKIYSCSNYQRAKSSLGVARHLKSLNLTLASGRKKKCKYLSGFKVEAAIINMSFAKPPDDTLVAFPANY